MWSVGAGLGGLTVAVMLWRSSLYLAPDARGRSLAGLPRVGRRALEVATVVGGAAGAMAVAAVAPANPAAVTLTFFAATSPCLAAVDAVTHRLPFAFTGGIAAGAVVGFGWEAVASGESGPLARAVLASVVVGILALAWWRLFGDGIGLGDVALLAVIGLYCGWWSWVAVWGGITLGFVLAALAVGMAHLRVRRPGAYMPLGPWLLGGCWVALTISLSQS